MIINNIFEAIEYDCVYQVADIVERDSNIDINRALKHCVDLNRFDIFCFLLCSATGCVQHIFDQCVVKGYHDFCSELLETQHVIVTEYHIRQAIISSHAEELLTTFLTHGVHDQVLNLNRGLLNLVTGIIGSDIILHLACRYGKIEVIKLMIEYNADIFSDNCAAMELAIYYSQADTIKYLIDSGYDKREVVIDLIIEVFIKKNDNLYSLLEELIDKKEYLELFDACSRGLDVRIVMNKYPDINPKEYNSLALEIILSSTRCDNNDEEVKYILSNTIH